MVSRVAGDVSGDPAERSIPPAGELAHDVNTLLGVIANCATLIGRRVDDPTVRDELAEITAAVGRAATLTRHLATVAHTDVARRGPVDVADVVREFTPTLTRVLGPGIVVQTNTPTGPAVAHCDRVELERLLLNVATNARDAMPDGGDFILTVDEVPGGVLVTAADTGAGMDAETAARAFEPYFSTKEPDLGTGLGLTLVDDIARRNGGAAAIDSVAGEGTRITVRLDRFARARAAAAS